MCETKYTEITPLIMVPKPGTLPIDYRDWYTSTPATGTTATGIGSATRSGAITFNYN